jgi:hypothetical protein
LVGRTIKMRLLSIPTNPCLPARARVGEVRRIHGFHVSALRFEPHSLADHQSD